MSTLIINYDLLGTDNGDIIKSVVDSLRKANMPDSKIYGTLKTISATFKEVFEKAVQLVSDKPPSVTEKFNAFIAAKEWQDRFSEADQTVIQAEGMLDAVLSQLNDLKVRWEPIYSKGHTPEIIGLNAKLMKADNKEAFEVASEPIANRESAYLGIAKVSHDAILALWPGGMTKTVKDGHEQPEWKAIKVERDDETGKWEAAGRVQAPVDPNKPKTVRIGGKGRALTITYGEELVYRGGNLNLAYSEAGRFCASRKLGPFAAKPDFGLKNGEKVIVATKWDEVGKPALIKSGLTVVEE